MAWGAEPRDRERSLGGEARKTRAAGSWRRRSKQRMGAHPRIIWEFHWRILGSSVDRQSPERASSAGGEAPERIGQSRAATRLQPAELCQVYQTWPGRLGYPRDPGPERIERPSEQLRTLAADRAQEADQITAP